MALLAPPMILLVPRLHYASRLRRSLPARDLQFLNGNVIVFGPGGQASILAPEKVEDTPPDSPPIQPSGPGDPNSLQAGGISSDSTVASTKPLLPTPVSSTPVSIQALPSPAPGISSSSPVDSGATSSSPSTSSSATTTTNKSQTSSPQSSETIPPSTSVTSAPSATGSSSAAPIQSAVATTPSPTAASAASSHKTSSGIGIAFGTITAVAFLAALVAFFFRAHRRARQRRRTASSKWPWNDDQGMEEKDIGFGYGVGVGHSSGTGGWDHEPEPVLDAAEPADSYYRTEHGDFHQDLFGSVQFPPGIHVESRGEDSHNQFPNTSPLPPSVVSADFGAQHGSLQIANMVPGDVVLSGDEFSRPATALDMAPQDRVLGTPRELVPGEKPRFLGLHDGGLRVPWGKDTEHGSDDGVSRESNWEPLPFPGDSSARDAGTACEVPSGRASEGWTASLRSNLANALSAVSGGYISGSSQGIEEDKFTSLPRRTKRTSTRNKATRQPLGRDPTTRSTASKLWTLEETAEGAGVVHIRGSHEDVGPTPPLKIATKPAAVLLKSHQKGQLFVPAQSASVTRASSIYSTASASEFDTEPPPRLPSIPPMSRNLSLGGTKNGMSSAEGGTMRRTSQFRKEERMDGRPKVMTRLSSSNCSSGSCGSEVSTSSSERLSDEEKAAQKALRERRRKVMGMGIGRGRVGTLKAVTSRMKSRCKK
ncbi:hypothetical protein JAAARDRAFT_320385 [Jaapia argillacea MUCL 33604]|uniref:Uncharacterized protein n=1 Tax=Jaapia argillacea MUCL 33604 TaxID=933084 RepID=A0A067Q0F1_9AGAM|nr:hypothetical protein JAAARDRAFT_320385 [Jaapia argillacea MUCL 33604]